MSTAAVVPLLSDLTDEELAAVVGKHLGYCHKHADLREPQNGRTQADMQDESFRCSLCGHAQAFNLRHDDTHSLDRYICEFLLQGVKFNRKHQKCVVPQ